MAAYTGLTLALQTVAPRAAWAVPWAWLSISLVAGYRLVPGSDPQLRDWAYPLSPAANLPLLTVMLLALGCLGYVARARSG